MFRRSTEMREDAPANQSRVDSVLGAGIVWKGTVSGSGGVRIEGAFDGEISLRGLVVVSPKGRVTCEEIRALTLVVAGSVKGNITARKVEITGSGRVWGDVTTTSFSTEEGAFLRGKITMEDEIDLGWEPEPETVETEGEPDENGLATRPADRS
jgi:cytoskeletal protein CcmA (bactofilin family)